MNILGLMAGAAAASASPQYPVADVLNEMRSACAETLTNDSAREKLADLGWAPAGATHGSWVEQALKEEQAVFGKKIGPSKVFAKTVQGQHLFVFVNAFRVNDATVRLCTAQDPEADLESAPQQLVQWAGRPATSPTFGLDPELVDGLDNITFMKNWKPGLDGIADDTTIRYVPLRYSPISHGQNGGLTYSTELEIKDK